MQRSDFEGLFRAMDGSPVIIRLLDPPLHEFLPDYTDLMVEIERMKQTGVDAAANDDRNVGRRNGSNRNRRIGVDVSGPFEYLTGPGQLEDLEDLRHRLATLCQVGTQRLELSG